MKPRPTTGAFRTLYAFRHTMTSEGALRAIRYLIETARPDDVPDVLNILTRREMAGYYDKQYQGD